jgi:hypothetical protein
MREERIGADQEDPTPMRALVLASLISLAGCIDNERVRVESFTSEPAGSFTFTVQTNTVMTANDDGEAEQIRRDWLAETLTAQAMCNGGYVVETRRLVVPVDPGNSRDIVYSGRCL